MSTRPATPGRDQEDGKITSSAPQHLIKADANPSHRADIDGLRAVAVLPVVLFHADPNWIQGGFAGVDVFFVISGFLISGIIFQAVLDERFSYAHFYARRIRRIFPALVTVLAASAFAGFFLLFATEFRRMLIDMAAAAAFVANIQLWRETGYFDPAVALKPMLHLWSLGVEEQYYIVWPLIATVLVKRVRRFAVPLMLMMLITSFILNVLLTVRRPSAAFYLPPPRFWELLLGSLLAWFSSTRDKPGQAMPAVVATLQTPTARNVLSSVGFGMIALSIVALRPEGFPGWSALMPTIGATLLLAAGPTAWVNRYLLASPSVVFIGLISYPLYLWHWPILSFLRISVGDELTPQLVFGAVAATFLLAWLTRELVEQPLRTGTFAGTKIAGLSIIMTVIGVSALVGSQVFPLRTDQDRYVAYFDNLWPDYEYFRSHNLFVGYRTECDFFDVVANTPRERIASACTTPSTTRSVLIWGDSHAQHLAPGLAASLPSIVSQLQIATSACRPRLQDSGPRALACQRSNELARKTIAQVKPTVVVIAQRNGHAGIDWDQMAAGLHDLGVEHVVVVGPAPKWNTELPTFLARQFWPTLPEWIEKGSVEDDLTEDEELRTRFKSSTNLTYVSLVSEMCRDGQCRAFIGPDEREDIVTFDYGHLTPAASRWIVERTLAPIVRNLLAIE